MLGCWATYSCDSTATLYTSEVKWDQLVVMSAVPMQRSAGENGASVYQPTCRALEASPDGLIFNVLFQGSVKKDAQADNDLSIKPYDRIDLKTIAPNLVTPELFTMGINCMEPSPDPDTSAGHCPTNVKADSLTIGDVSYYAYGYGEEGDTRGNVALAVLIDMSGSMGGLVYPFPPYYEDKKSAVTSAFPTGFYFRNNATDPGNARLSAVVDLIKSLNPNDELIVFTYNESKVDVVCELKAEPNASYETKLAQCFGTNRELVLGPDPDGSGGPLMSLTGLAEGRTPLWYAVREAYNYMKVADAAKDATYRHILVIGDGPDTCAPSAELNQCSGACAQYNTDFLTVQQLIEADEPDDRIPIHFVQMSSKGYPERDGRQVEVACLTGGHHVFVNATEIGSGLLNDYLASTLKRIRYTFRGYWRFAMLFSAMGRDIAPSRGYVYTIAGEGKVLPGVDQLLVKAENSYQFIVGGGLDDASEADHRVAVRKACTPGSDDGKCKPGDAETGPAKACATMTYWCDEQSLTCKSAEIWKADGEEGGCAPASAKVKIFKSTNDTSPDIVTFSNLPTRCCAGDCRPPAPPAVPFSSTVFNYEKDGEWYLETPDDPNSAWIVDASYRSSADPTVSLQNVKDALVYANPAGLAWPDDWSCPAEKSKNCFPGPDAE